MPLPLPRPGGTPYRIAIVCLGNICRSPMAHVVLTHRLAEVGLDDAVEVSSAGTGDWHVGQPMDRRAAAVLTAHAYDASRHRAARFDTASFETCDLVLAMDASNLADLRALLPGENDGGRLRLFRDFDPLSFGPGDRDVPDPYYGGDDGFEVVLTMVARTCDRIAEELQHLLARRPDRQRAGG